IQAVISSNDDMARIMNLERLELTHEYRMPWAVNRLLCVCGDAKEALLVSVDSGDKLFQLEGHVDYSFACVWSPCGRLIATGNQDMTTRLYDIRFPSRSLAVLPARLGAVRSLRFSDDGVFLAAAESADFVHVYDVRGVRGAAAAPWAPTIPAARAARKEEGGDGNDTGDGGYVGDEDSAGEDAYSSPLVVPPPLALRRQRPPGRHAAGSSLAGSSPAQRGASPMSLSSSPPPPLPMSSTAADRPYKPTDDLRAAIQREAAAAGLVRPPRQRRQPKRGLAAAPWGTGIGGDDDGLLRCQVLDFFGEVAGIAFAPGGGDFLYVGNSDDRYGSILEFERLRAGPRGGDLTATF
ncbi:hypothetical protein HK405_012959, partial [Cladochytrium tenue]